MRDADLLFLCYLAVCLFVLFVVDRFSDGDKQ